MQFTDMSEFNIVKLWWNQAKWVGTRKYWFKEIQPNKADNSLFSIVFATIQNVISQKPIAQSQWGCHQIRA